MKRTKPIDCERIKMFKFFGILHNRMHVALAMDDLISYYFELNLHGAHTRKCIK